jgi:hypothetical protein
MTSPIHSTDAFAVVQTAAEVIAPVFAANGWQWATAEHDVPSSTDIALAFTTMIEQLRADDSLVRLSTGRLTVTRDGLGRLHLDLDLGTVEPA